MQNLETQILHQLVEDQIVQLKSEGYFEFASGIK